MRFFNTPLNYGTGRTMPSTLADGIFNRPEVISTAQCFIDSDGDGTGTAGEFTHIYFSIEGVQSIAMVVIGGNIVGQTLLVPTELTNDSGVTNDLIGLSDYPDRQSVLFDLESIGAPNPTGRSLNFTFAPMPGTPMPILYQIMVLKREITLTGDTIFRRLDYDLVRSGHLDIYQTDRGVFVPSWNGRDHLWRVDIEAIFTSNIDQLRTLRQFFRVNPNFVVETEYERYPDRVFPALLENDVISTRYLGISKATGESIRFALRQT